MRILNLLLLCLLCIPAFAQLPDINSFNPDDVLIGDRKQPKVLLLGTFHFDYPNLDAHVTDEAAQVNVTDQKRAAELQELLDYVARFKPNKIVVERWQGSNVNDNYQKYLAGEFKLPKSETYQIGYRLGKRFGLDSLVLGDAATLVRSLYYHPDSAVLRPLLDSIYNDWDFSNDSPIDQAYDRLYDIEDEILVNSTLLDYFKYENSPHRIKRGHGAYLIGDFELDDHRGADALAMHWYARNLRIYRNIQKATTSPDDRILVIIGAGHLGILRQQFESSPQYELIDFGDL